MISNNCNESEACCPIFIADMIADDVAWKLPRPTYAQDRVVWVEICLLKG